jgi:glycerophosphoryl diester phosphodiesterase
MLTSDGYPIAYHGFNLDKYTNGTGNPESYKLQELKQFDAAYKFNAQYDYPLRNKGIQIPTLKGILLALPANPDFRLILDLKSHDNQKLIKSIIETINHMDTTQDYWKKIIFYSTDEKALPELKSLEPRAQIFLSRHETLKLLLNRQLSKKQENNIKNVGWIGFEMERELCEKFTLGENCVKLKSLWTAKKIEELKKINPNIQVIIFAADSESIHQEAKNIKADYLYVNKPSAFNTCCTE